MRTLAVSAALLCSAAAQAGGYEWVNVASIPGDLLATNEAWTAARIEDPEFISYRIAAEDFVLAAPTTITRIEFWTVKFGDPPVLGADWYVYRNEGGTPGALLASGTASDYVHTQTEWTHPDFGPIWTNVIHPEGLSLPCGNYFLAVRTHIGWNGSKHSLLTTRWTNGTSRGWWNFEVYTDGSVGDAWVLMQVFNLYPDNEWALRLSGETACVGDLDGDGAIGQSDLALLLSCYQTGPCGDLDCDGDTDQADLAGLLAVYGQNCP